MLTEAILPTRPDEEILAGRVGVTLGGQSFALPVLSIALNRAYKVELLTYVYALIDLLDEQTELGSLLRHLAQGTERQLDAIALYDQTGVLPPREWIEANATEDELWAATKAVIAAAFPFVDGLRQAVPTLVELIRTLRAASTSTWPRPTAGRRGLFRRN